MRNFNALINGVPHLPPPGIHGGIWLFFFGWVFLLNFELYMYTRGGGRGYSGLVRRKSLFLVVVRVWLEY